MLVWAESRTPRCIVSGCVQLLVTNEMSTHEVHVNPGTSDEHGVCMESLRKGRGVRTSRLPRPPPRPPGGRDGDGVERDENELIDWPFVHWGLGPRLRCHMDLILGCLDPVSTYYFA